MDDSKLTDDHIEQFGKSIIEKEDVLYEPVVINNALNDIRMSMHINDDDSNPIILPSF